MSNWYKRLICSALLFAAIPTAGFAAGYSDESQASIGVDPVELIGPDAAYSTILPSAGRYVLVDAGAARLFMIEDGRVTDSMRVIVGKPASATPVMKSMLESATLNPYWNVPTDLAQTIIAPRVLDQGAAYLRKHRYVVVSAFSADATEISVESVNWKAVAAGSETVFVRQLPGRSNSMGQIKFGFPGSDGIFLHDTPDRKLFAKTERNLSNGCVRLEDARRLARWLFGTEPSAQSDAPEQTVSMPAGVPIMITYSRPREPVQIAELR